MKEFIDDFRILFGKDYLTVVDFDVISEQGENYYGLRHSPMFYTISLSLNKEKLIIRDGSVTNSDHSYVLYDIQRLLSKTRAILFKVLQEGDNFQLTVYIRDIDRFTTQIKSLVTEKIDRDFLEAFEATISK